jgi:3-methylcrotonyl-CoA carboxylase alpha subunit
VKSLRLRHGADLREVRLEKGVAWFGDRRAAFELPPRAGVVKIVRVDGHDHRIVTAREGERVSIWCDGVAATFELATAAARTASSADPCGDLFSPMPGRVRKLLVAQGKSVSRGEVLLVLEAMKMEHSIRAPRDGVVKKLHVREGELVEAGKELAEIG